MSHLPGSWGGFGNQAVKYKPNSENRPAQSRADFSRSSDEAAASAQGSEQAARIPPRALVSDQSVASSRRPRTTQPRRGRHMSLAAKLAAATAGAESVTALLNPAAQEHDNQKTVQEFSCSSPLLSLPTVCMVVGATKRYVRAHEATRRAAGHAASLEGRSAAHSLTACCAAQLLDPSSSCATVQCSPSSPQAAANR